MNIQLIAKKIKMISRPSSLCSDSDTFLHFDSLKPFADHLNFDVGLLSNELAVVKQYVITAHACQSFRISCSGG
jgi:hypothetical protein